MNINLISIRLAGIKAGCINGHCSVCKKLSRSGDRGLINGACGLMQKSAIS